MQILLHLAYRQQAGMFLTWTVCFPKHDQGDFNLPCRLPSPARHFYSTLLVIQVVDSLHWQIPNATSSWETHMLARLKRMGRWKRGDLTDCPTVTMPVEDNSEWGEKKDCRETLLLPSSKADWWTVLLGSRRKDGVNSFPKKPSSQFSFPSRREKLHNPQQTASSHIALKWYC